MCFLYGYSFLLFCFGFSNFRSDFRIPWTHVSIFDLRHQFWLLLFFFYKFLILSIQHNFAEPTFLGSYIFEPDGTYQNEFFKERVQKMISKNEENLDSLILRVYGL